MVSFKSLTLLTLSVTAATAFPQNGHGRFHRRAPVEVPKPVEADTAHAYDHNDTESGPVVAELKRDVDAPVKLVAPVRRWNDDNGNPWYQGQYTSAPAATTSASYAGATGVTGGSKKGLSYNSNALLNQFTSAGASWTYNWGAGAGGNVPAGMEYVPMLWGTKDIGAWSGAVKSAQASGSTHALSFNEPDFPTQANLDAATAAKLHIANMAPLSGSMKVGSPAITNSNIPGQGLDWMRAFLSACGGAANNCKIDFLAFHWYNNPGTFSNFKEHVSTVINLAKQNGIPKVWLTEFAVNGGAADQASFLAQALPYLDSTPEVERYAYFMVAEGQMLTGGALNAIGKAYSS